jgi:hypothetical protein
MRYWRVGVWFLAAQLVPSVAPGALHHHGGCGHGRPSGIAGAVGGGWLNYGFPYWMTVGPDGLPLVIAPRPPVVVVPGVIPVAVPDRGVLGGPMPLVNRPIPRLAPPVIRAKGNPNANPAPRKADVAKGEQLVTIGDRLFRAGNFKRAVERYEQAQRLDSGAAAPLVRLAQVALVRGQYAEAAQRFREAIAAEPGWLGKARDIQSIYGEPTEFNRPIARLESHLLADPNDRDGWFVLGAQYYLSGRTRRAADVFLRLTDRKPDPALAALLDATGAKQADAD